MRAVLQGLPVLQVRPMSRAVALLLGQAQAQAP